MNCLEKILCDERVIIGVRNFDGCTKPESSLFINDYPGVDLKTASKITGDELLTGNKALQECTKLAIKYVNSDLQDFINQRFRFNNIAETRQTDVNFTSELIPAANANRGRTLTRWRSELAKIFVEEVYLKPDADIVVDIYIQDGITVKKYEGVVLVAEKVNVVQINYIAQSEKITIYCNQASAGFYNCSSPYFKQSCNVCGRSGKSSNSEFLMRGWNGTVEDGNCYGMGVLASVRCYYEDIFCRLLPNLYFPLYYRSVIEFMNMRIHTTRVNNIAIFGVEKAKELKEEVEELYIQKMKRVTDNSHALLQSIKGDCIICNSMTYVESTP